MFKCLNMDHKVDAAWLNSLMCGLRFRLERRLTSPFFDARCIVCYVLCITVQIIYTIQIHFVSTISLAARAKYVGQE